jgi:hypothetical protein
MARQGLQISLLCALVGGILTINYSPRATQDLNQEQITPTAPVGVSIATVNIGDNPDINVRSGPSVDYPIIGKLLAGQQVPAFGRSPGGDWVQISFPQGPGGVGWVYSYLVTIAGNLPIAVPPPTPTPRVTPTIDPTLAAQFIREPVPTRLPTFTAPPPLELRTYPEAPPPRAIGGAPLMYAIIFLGLIGLLGTILSYLRMR